MSNKNDELQKLYEQNQALLEELKAQREQPTQIELPQMSFWDKVKEFGLFAAVWHVVGAVVHGIIGALFE